MGLIIDPEYMEKDEPDNQIGFTCCELHGWEVYKIPESAGLTPRQLLYQKDWPVDSDGKFTHHRTLTNATDIKAGDRIIFKGNPFDYLYDDGEVVVMESGDHRERLYASTGQSISSLEFDTDHRHCWLTSGSVINLRAIAAIKSSTFKT